MKVSENSDVVGYSATLVTDDYEHAAIALDGIGKVS